MKVKINAIHINARIREDLGNDFDLLKDSIQNLGFRFAKEGDIFAL